jgi:hypothetical protein
MSETTAVKQMEETKAEVQMHVLQTKSLTWPELHRGDCQQDNGRLLFHSDGTGTWSATVLTYHTTNRDIWHAGFAVKGSNGATLFNLGPWDGPNMHDGNPPPKYSWVKQFSFPPDFFNGIAEATQNCSC